MEKAAFLDRDGVINRKAPDSQYVTRWEDFQLLPGVIEGITQLNRAGYRVIVITNQRCVAKGLLTEDSLKAIHQQMSHHLEQQGAKIDAIYYCPHELEPPCRCRKPAPGMLVDAASSLNFDLAASWMIGDSEIDIQAGKAAGCKTARLLADGLTEGPVRHDRTDSTAADVAATSLLAVISLILHFGHS